jgi:hypothetical protein
VGDRGDVGPRAAGHDLGETSTVPKTAEKLNAATASQAIWFSGRKLRQREICSVPTTATAIPTTTM